MVKVLQRILVLLLATFILLPTEEDGVFNSIFLTHLNSPSSIFASKNIHSTDKLEETEISNLNDNATFARSRCDFLDLVYDTNYSDYGFHQILFSKLSFPQNDSHFFLLSDLLLNLPPPIT